MLHSLIARWRVRPQTQWRPRHKAFTSGLRLDAMSLAWPTVVLAFWSPCLWKRELVFVLIVHLFVSYAHVNLCHFFSSSWCQGLTAASACGSSWTFLFTFFKVFYFDWHFCAQIWTSVAFILYIYITNRIPNHWYNVMSVLCMYLHICITYSLFLVKFNLSVFKFSKMFHMDKKKTIKKSRVGKKWTSPVLPHPQFSNDCCLHHQSFRTLIFSA